MRFICPLIMASLLAACSSVAMASILGDTVDVQYLFPDMSTPFGLSASGVVTASGITLNLFDNQHVIVLPDSVQMIGVRDPSSFFQSALFNGVSIQDLTNPTAFTGFSVDSATTISAFNIADISIGSGKLFINYQSLVTPLNSLAQVDFTTGVGPNAPEPSTLLVSLLGLGFLAAHRFKKASA